MLLQIEKLWKLRRGDEYFDQMMIKRPDGHMDAVIIPPLMKKSLQMIANHEGMSIEDLCIQIMSHKKAEVKAIDVLYVFVMTYLEESLQRQCSECPISSELAA